MQPGKRRLGGKLIETTSRVWYGLGLHDLYIRTLYIEARWVEAINPEDGCSVTIGLDRVELGGWRMSTPYSEYLS